jgi:DNA repair protein RadC
VKTEDLIRDSLTGGTQFDPIQLDLPLGPLAKKAGHETNSPGSLSLDRALFDYLEIVGVSDPQFIARMLVAEFGSVADVISASWWRLRTVVGARLACTIHASRDLISAALLEPVKRGPVIPRSQALVSFLQAHIGYLDHECVLALYVDSRLHLLRIERLTEGSTSDASIDIRRILRCGLEVAASGFLLVHNHPSGSVTPSKSDVSLTCRLKSIAAELDLHLLDHLILARGRVASIFEHWQEDRWAGREQ